MLHAIFSAITYRISNLPIWRLSLHYWPPLSGLLFRIYRTIFPSQKSSGGQDTENSAHPSAAIEKDPAIAVPRYGHLIQRGELIAGGASGIVELLPSGDAIKTPWNGDTGHLCRRELTLESQIYARLGSHPRLVKMISWDPDQYALTMEYMPNGCLKDHLAQNKDISTTQRLRWAQEAAEGLQLLHSANVIHCDVAPKNFLLDAHLSLKIADFGGSSLNFSYPSACGSVRFVEANFSRSNPPTIQEDLYALGSTIYCIMTSRYPYEELESNEVRDRYKVQDFPDVAGILCGGIILRCWRSEVTSAQEVCDFIQSIDSMDALCKVDICSSLSMLTAQDRATFDIAARYSERKATWRAGDICCHGYASANHNLYY